MIPFKWTRRDEYIGGYNKAITYAQWWFQYRKGSASRLVCYILHHYNKPFRRSLTHNVQVQLNYPSMNQLKTHQLRSRHWKRRYYANRLGLRSIRS